MRAETGAARQAGLVLQAAPVRPARLLLRLEAARADETVAIMRLAAAEIDLVDHAVAVERVIFAQRLVNLVLGIAQINAVEILRDRALDHLEVISVDLFILRGPCTGQIGVVARLKRAADCGQPLDCHGHVLASSLAFSILLLRIAEWSGYASLFAIHRACRPGSPAASTGGCYESISFRRDGADYCRWPDAAGRGAGRDRPGTRRPQTGELNDRPQDCRSRKDD